MKQILGKRLKSAILVMLILFCINVTFSSYCIAKPFSESDLKRIIVLEPRNISIGLANKELIREALIDVLEKKGVDIILFSEDELLQSKDTFSKGIFKLEDLKKICMDKNIDGVVFANITTFQVPGDQERVTGAFIPFVNAIVKVEAKVRVYSFKQDNIAYEYQILGYSKPSILKLESFGINLNAAMGRFKEHFEKLIEKEVSCSAIGPGVDYTYVPQKTK